MSFIQSPGLDNWQVMAIEFFSGNVVGANGSL